MRASILAFLVAVSGLMPVGSFGDEAALRNRSAYAEGKLLGAMIREFMVLKYESGDSEQLAIVRERATLLSKALNELMWGLERRKRARYDFEPRLTEEEVLDRDFWKGVEAGLGTRIAVKKYPKLSRGFKEPLSTPRFIALPAKDSLSACLRYYSECVDCLAS